MDGLEMDFDDLFMGPPSGNRSDSRASGRRESQCSFSEEEVEGPIVWNPRAASFRPMFSVAPTAPADPSSGVNNDVTETAACVQESGIADRDSNKSDAETFIDEDQPQRASCHDEVEEVAPLPVPTVAPFSRPHSLAGFFDKDDACDVLLRRQSYPCGSSLSHAKRIFFLHRNAFKADLRVDASIPAPVAEKSEQDDLGLASPTTPPTPVSPRQLGPRPCLDDFQRLHMIGEGGFGKVYLVRKKQTGEIFALKSMRKDFVIRSNLDGTKTERSILEKMRHPFIVKLHYAFQNEGRLFLVMDYISGGQILTHLEKQAIFSEDAARFYCAEIALALKELHSRNIIHRDLKPENILLTASGHVVVTDFGCSKVTCEGGRASSFVGTDMYMAPEQITARDQNKSYGFAVDWWALGCLAWEMMTGRNPFEAKEKPQTIKKVMHLKLTMPKFLMAPTHSFLKLCLTRDPEKRLGAKGADEVLAHKFFTSINMEDLLAGKIAAPLRPCMESMGSLDVSNVKDHYLKASIAESPVDASPLTLDQQLLFRGFTYERDSPFRAMVASEALEDAMRSQETNKCGAAPRSGGMLVMGTDSAFGGAKQTSDGESDSEDSGAEEDRADGGLAEAAWLEDQALDRVERPPSTRPVRVKPAQFEYPIDAASVAKALCSAGPTAALADPESKAKVVKNEKKMKQHKSSKQHGQKSNKKKR